ncbi:unnamed protein product [Notodromas monacha]|uniref:Tr-type G domain-containing protein n=1 Tax=Notodromas monacha TaxID=399045 RepID=A0A7R9G8J4_9CRUS|nr:unnamed protein product [Notodromas monacha]CAG0913245.1 unnamed protein product [Notodromas monacha]
MDNLHELFGDSKAPKKSREGKKKWRRRVSKDFSAQQKTRGSSIVVSHEEVVIDFRMDANLIESLPPEPALGNIEYKLKLVNPTRQRFEHLVTQMKWRLREGEGEAIYEIGIEDNGHFLGLSPHELSASLETLRMMAAQLGATVKILRKQVVQEGEDQRHSAEVLVRKIPDDRTSIELRIAVLGNADVGKSTLLGVLTQGELDNGRGRARLIMFRHLHEVQTGRTSSISHEIMGFDAEGNVMTYQQCGTAEDIVQSSAKLITFIDLAGHYKYLHTTINGLTGYCPHYIMLVISANTGIAGTTLDHLNLALALDVPFFIVVTKIDVTPSHVVEKTVAELQTFLRSETKRDPLMVCESADLSKARGVQSILCARIVPIFLLSSVTGKGLELLREFLHALPPYLSAVEREELEQLPVQFQIDETWNIPEVGAVVGGLLTRGVITENIRLQLGPVEGRKFIPVLVKTIHRNKTHCSIVRASQSASLSLFPVDNSSANSIPPLRKGMVLLDPGQEARVTKHFLAKLTLTAQDDDSPIVLKKGGHAVLNIGNVRQGAVVCGIFGAYDGIRKMRIPQYPGGALEPVSVMFEFLRGPEYLECGARVLFRHGNTKGQGYVSHVYYLESSAGSWEGRDDE